MHAEHAQPPDEGVHRYLENVRQRVLAGVRRDGYGLLAGIEGRWIALFRVGHELGDDVQKLADAGPRLCRREADRHQVPLAQGRLERVMELFRLQILTLLQVKLHELLVHFHDLVDDAGMRVRHRGERDTVALRIEETVDNFFLVSGRQIDGQALVAKRFADLPQQGL